MSDPKEHGAQLLRARERLARAFARLETLIGGYSERIRLLEVSRDGAERRVRETVELLERERAITTQRQSLSDSAAEEIQSLKSKLEKAENSITEFDKQILALEHTIDEQKSELLRYESARTESVEREKKLHAEIDRQQEENHAAVRQLELMKEEREHLHKQLAEIEEKNNTYALTFSQDERLGVLKTIDSLIERVDAISGNYDV